LWTADLCEGEVIIENLGGSYPKSYSTMIDARKTWGQNLEVKILPGGIPAPVSIDDEIIEYIVD
jgi:hypothetical protein